MEDKFKILRNAERFVVNRQYDRAVTEYRKIVETLGEDPSVLNTLGDLLLKTGRKDEALDSFRKVAEIFTQSGFVSKAIAIYRKVDQLGPGNRQVVQRLAELYIRRGLPSESLRYWRKLAALLEDSDDADAQVTARRRILELDDQNPEAHSGLAKVLAHLDPDEASNEWLSAARLLFSAEAYRDAREAAEQALTLNAAGIDARELIADVNEKIPPETEETPVEELGAGSDTADHEAETETAADVGTAEPTMVESPEASAITESAAEPSIQEESAPEEERSDSGDWAGGLVVPEELESGTEAEPEVFNLEAPEERVGVRDDETATALFGVETEASGEPESVESGLDAQESDGQEEEFWETSSSSGPQESASESEVREPPAAPKPADAAVVGPGPERSLESSLEEADFYLKLDLRSDAERVLEGLLVSHPGDARVRARAEKIGLIVSSEVGVRESGTPFESNVDSALEDLFFDDAVLKETSAGRLAELESKGEGLRNDPRSQYDLGVAYREMGMLEDAAAKFERAYQLFSDEEDPEQALLCSSMLTSTYLKLRRFDKSVEWADIGLSLPRVEGIERKALEYDRAVALEQLGENEESLNGYRRILELDPDFRDVRQRAVRMAHEPE